jgi:hypothetical protein
MTELETVKIECETDGGWALINKSDYDEKIHTLFVEPEEKPPEKPPTKPPAK